MALRNVQSLREIGRVMCYTDKPMSHTYAIHSLLIRFLPVAAALVLALTASGCQSDESIKEGTAAYLAAAGNETLARISDEFKKFDTQYLDNKAPIMQMERAADPAFKWLEQQRNIAEAESWTPRDVLWEDNLKPLSNFLYELKTVRFIIDPGSNPGQYRYSVVVYSKVLGEEGEFNELRAKYQANLDAMNPQRESMLSAIQRLQMIIRVIGESAPSWSVGGDGSTRMVSGKNLGIGADDSLTEGVWKYDTASKTAVPASPEAESLSKLLSGA